MLRFLIAAANIGPNRFHQYRTVSWQISMPRSNKRSSTCRSESASPALRNLARRLKPIYSDNAAPRDLLWHASGHIRHERYIATDQEVEIRTRQDLRQIKAGVVPTRHTLLAGTL